MLTTTTKYRYLYLILAWLCVILGIIGAFLPLMPTTVFLLIATWAFSKSSPYWHQWIRNHQFFGTTIRAWEKHHAISQKTKYGIFVTLMMSYLITAVILGPLSTTAIITAICISGVAVYISNLPVLKSKQLQTNE